MVLEKDDDTEKLVPTYTVFSGLISIHEVRLLEIFKGGDLWAPRNKKVNAHLALISYFFEKKEADAFQPGNPVDETHLKRVVPREMRKMLKAMQRKYLLETYDYMLVNPGHGSYDTMEDVMFEYIDYLQDVVKCSPGLLSSCHETTIENLPFLLGLHRKPDRDSSPERGKIIKSSSQDLD
jgi:hypothetical protein